ncbi:hypothetical protein SEA_KEANEYLIN_80 [Arthrobacter phage KeaneyLin]|uniref:Uncharacterized protein n=1 Tax=Arthrobacter phage KeaneyLin TaxID=2250412 RepID=A0A345KMG6_9CAUD|nr:hypothetical protein PQB83_gp80 [Arthrobacter phage KeaneyLin]AXH44218.1 hypothetical protein SEA_KEANEYLIN_80 [Arthrobacter phage KeaneyLin]WBF79127.1 hypothetical protein SEA_HANKLY_83 [Arthrobacter phage Hankly]
MLAIQIYKGTLDLVSRETGYDPARLKRSYIGWYCLSDEGRSWELMRAQDFVQTWQFSKGAVSNRFEEVIKKTN